MDVLRETLSPCYLALTINAHFHATFFTVLIAAINKKKKAENLPIKKVDGLISHRMQ